VNTETYISQLQTSKQWGAFLFSLANELETLLDPDQIRKLMFQTGARMAKEFPAAAEDSLDTVSQIINEIWMECSWGWVVLTDLDDRIRIEHHFSPFSNTFGTHSRAWSGQLLAGFYSSIFKQLGAADELHIRQVEDNKDDNMLLFEFCPINA